MWTVSRTFWIPKDIGYDGDYEDALAVNEGQVWPPWQMEWHRRSSHGIGPIS